MKIQAAISALALALTAAACDGGSPSAIVGTTSARVRFVNAVSGVNGNVLLTANGTAVGSAQTFGTFNSTCSTVSAGGGRTLAFGTTTSGSTISGNLGTMTTTLASGGKYTVIATGSSTNPTLLVLNNTAASAGSGNANVRFVNASGQALDFFATSNATLSLPTFANIAANNSSAFLAIPTANSTLTFRAPGSSTALFTNTVTFAPGQNYTILLLPNATGTGFQTMTLTDC